MICVDSGPNTTSVLQKLRIFRQNSKFKSWGTVPLELKVGGPRHMPPRFRHLWLYIYVISTRQNLCLSESLLPCWRKIFEPHICEGKRSIVLWQPNAAYSCNLILLNDRNFHPSLFTLNIYRHKFDFKHCTSAVINPNQYHLKAQ